MICDLCVKMWKVLLCLSVVGGCWAGSESWLNNIGRNLRADMMNVMEMGYVNYSEPNINTTYVSKSEFDMRAMGHLYNSTHIIIDTIVSEQAYPEGIVSVSDGHVEFSGAQGKWRTLLAHYAGPVAVVTVAALLVAILPLAGLFWCCCHWCRSGRRRRAFDRKYDACFKGILAILLIALLTLFLFGVVCAFVTEEQAEAGARDAAGALRAGARDARAYLNATQAHARWILVNNYKELENKLNAMLTSCGLTVSLQLGEFSRAVSVTTLYTMVQQLDGVQRNLQQVQNLTAALRINAEKLNSGLRRVKAQLLQTLNRCEQPACIRLQEKYKIGQLDTEIPYSQMPNVSELLNNVTSLLDSNIKAEVGEGQKVFSEIQRGIQRSLDEHIPSVQESITTTGARLAAVADNITAAANTASEQVMRADREADRIQQLHDTYGTYRLYLGRATAAALLLMVVILAWGLVCGVCGKRADAYSADACCHKPHGARALLCGMGTMFLLGGVVALVMMIYFLVGITTQRFICDPLVEPRGNRLFSDLEVFVDLETQVYHEHQEPTFNITSVLISCHQNKTLYETLQLHRISALESLSASVSAEVSRRVGSLRPAFPPHYIQILKPSARDKLARLADTGLSTFNFDRILSALETNMTSLSLEGLATQLEAAAAGARRGMQHVAAELHDAAVLLRHYHADIVLPMRADTDTLNETTVRLRDGMRFNHSSLKQAIAYLMDETEQAEKFLNTLGPELIHNMTREFGGVVSGLVARYMERAQHAATQDVGACGPLSHAYNATRDALCVNVLMPVNGYWISLAWCLLLFAPILLVSQKLAKLYSHADPYPGPLVEAEYLYDAYADRDNVPLANAYKAEKRSGRGGGRGGTRGEAPGGREGARGEGPRGEGPRAEGARAAPPLDAHHARRYNDMAPKHWEEGPPRYHGPTEYERPPPYYYPGPNDRQ